MIPIMQKPKLMASMPDAQGVVILLLCPLLLVGGEERSHQLPLDAGQQGRPPPQGRLVVCHTAKQMLHKSKQTGK
jgi:hypothetical protein